MSRSVPLRCDCGAVQGELTASPGAGNRCVCFCDDCQAFAAALGRPDVLDAWGGTDIYQTAPARLRFTQGEGELRALRLSDKGLMRWHTACCKTPIGNTLASPRSPFVGVIHRFIALDAPARDEALGPVTSWVMGRGAKGGCPPHAHPSVPLSAIPGVIKIMVRGVFTSGTSPFVHDGAWRVTPEVLSPEARAALSPGAPAP